MKNKPSRNVSSIASSVLRYQDFVIKDGQLVGDWEGLYKNFEDPWHQSRDDVLLDSRRIIAVNWCNRLRNEYNANKVIELGCGFGHLTETLRSQSFAAVGVDISKTAIDKARNIHPRSVFVECSLSDFEIVKKFDADIYLMSEITWYVLDDLDDFLINLKKQSAARSRPIFLIHLLTTYAKGLQKYGVDKFTNLDEMLSYFKIECVESGYIRTPREDDASAQGTYFIGKI